MILYQSTRGDKTPYTFSQAILKGIAPDGGLFTPHKIPHLSLQKLKLMFKKSYQEKALDVLSIFKTDLPTDSLRKIVNKAYSRNFDDAEIAPIVPLKNNQYFLELWHGPTLSFKDMALQIMPYFFVQSIKDDSLKRRREGKESLRYLILVATSGDTGKAALEGFKDKEDILIMVFYPENRVSKLQYLQMATQEGRNVLVFALKGNFDKVQNIVKELFNDKAFNFFLLNKFNVKLSSANSINWGRLLPQVFYYVNSYLKLIEKGVRFGKLINIAVPTGNFGNILAAFYAKKMGLPINKLICATNENNVVSEFLQTGVYDVRERKLVKTPSPSMDILVASNIERLLFLITNSPKKVKGWMSDLKEKKRFQVDTKTRNILQKEFYSGWVSNKESLKNIKKIFKETGYLMDPHTSVAQVVLERFTKEKGVDEPILICSTAHWSKFTQNVFKSKENLPLSILDLKKKPIKHKKTLEANSSLVKKVIVDCLKKFD